LKHTKPQLAHSAALIRDQTEEKLRSAILEGRYPPGSRLIDRELCETLGVSRTSVREALRQLEARQLIKVEPRRGLVVTVISAKDAEEIYATRKILEAEVVALFIKNADQEAVDRLSGYLDSFAAAAKRRDVNTAVEVMTSFYKTLSKGAGNSVLADLLQLLNARISYLRATSMSSPNRMAKSAAEMTKIFRAIERRDERAARRACLQHINNAAEVAIRKLRWDEEQEKLSRENGRVRTQKAS
jgi:DNA-binding GntR family transcriptional regulator